MSKIYNSEKLWTRMRDWLLECGYMLRPRYQRDWKPSWNEDDLSGPYTAEDGLMLLRGNIMDATRISDGAFVVLKYVDPNMHPDEVKISEMLSTDPLKNDPRNHCVPVYEVLRIPYDTDVIIVTPLLMRYDHVRFDTVGEVVDMFRQVFEGLKFLHDNRIAHRDCTSANIMMDASPMYPEPWHPHTPDMKRDWSGRAKHYTRTQRPPRYYLIDFGLSKQYDQPIDEVWESDLTPGADASASEFVGWLDADARPQRPFPTDVYHVGNIIRRDFLEGRRPSNRKFGLGFMKPLVDKMVATDPEERPTMDAVVQEFEKIVAGLSGWKLRSRVVKANEFPGKGLYLGMVHWARRISLIVNRVPAIPKHESTTPTAAHLLALDAH